MRLGVVGYLSKEEEAELCKDLSNPANCERLLMGHTPLLKTIINGYGVLPRDFEDVFQECLLIMHRKAIPMYDPNRGVRFMTYANGWIWRAIQTYRAKNSIVRNTKAFRSVWEAHPITVKILDVGDPLRRRIENKLSEGVPWADERIEGVERRKVIERGLTLLNPRQRLVLWHRYLSDPDRVVTLQEVARLLGVSRERARQIECAALKKLRTEGDTDLRLISLG